ncbi:hypothetical protein [Mucilaginibacter humi]|nr:hypothetical protein [Mucilaginibacter humi]
MSILASILNALILLVTMGIIAGDAIHKFRHWRMSTKIS